MSKTGKDYTKYRPDLHDIPALNKVVQETGIDLYNSPEVDGFKHQSACIDYFSRRSEAKVVIDKSVSSAANFLYEVICRHEFMGI